MFRTNLNIKSINSRLKTIQIEGQRKAFCRQRIPKSSCATIPYRKDLNCLHFDDKPRVQQRQLALDHQSYIPILVAYLTYPSRIQEYQPKYHNNIPCKGIWQIYSDKGQPQKKKLRSTNQDSNFLRGSFSNKDQVRGPIQFTRKKNSPSILKYDFSSQEQTHSFSYQYYQSYQTGQTKHVEFFQY